MKEGLDHGLRWYRSRMCADNSCVEVTRAGDEVLIRNSERPHQIVRFTASEWTAFVAGIEAGESPVR
jgi:hypothetical protein